MEDIAGVINKIFSGKSSCIEKNEQKEEKSEKSNGCLTLKFYCKKSKRDTFFLFENGNQKAIFNIKKIANLNSNSVEIIKHSFEHPLILVAFKSNVRNNEQRNTYIHVGVINISDIEKPTYHKIDFNDNATKVALGLYEDLMFVAYDYGYIDLHVYNYKENSYLPSHSCIISKRYLKNRDANCTKITVDNKMLKFYCGKEIICIEFSSELYSRKLPFPEK